MRVRICSNPGGRADATGTAACGGRFTGTERRMGDWMDEWGQYGPQGERKERLDALRARLDARPRPDVESEDEDEGPRQDEREEDREDEPAERIPVEPAGEAESTAPLDLEAVAEAGGTEDATAGPSHRRALRAAAIVLAVLAAGGVGAVAVSGVQASQIRGLQASCQDARHAQGQAFDRLGEAMHGDAAALSRLPASAVQDPGCFGSIVFCGFGQVVFSGLGVGHADHSRAVPW
ncbi:hypothetical protein [Bifidobacterium subtile]|nr:hypothetical protein [Bifidobacterium subtile]QOL36494.1 hypothetical protein BS3272_00265 [Bifidobacterium subtile]